VTKCWQTRAPFDPETDWPGYFHPSPHFDLRDHVHYLSPNMSQKELLGHLGDIINTPPALDKPPWEILVRHGDQVFALRLPTAFGYVGHRAPPRHTSEQSRGSSGHHTHFCISCLADFPALADEGTAIITLLTPPPTHSLRSSSTGGTTRR
jgi:hypothetical protein